MQSMGHGAITSPEDYRQIKVEHIAGVAPATSAYPASFHIDFSKVPDMYQRQIGACTAHAFAEIYTHRQIRLGKTNFVASPRFIYALSKMGDAITDHTEQGTYVNMPFKVAVKFGVASQSNIPNDTTLSFGAYIYDRVVAHIPQSAFTEADANRIPGYVQVGSFNSISQAQLQQGLVVSQDGVSICMPIGAEFWTSASGKVSWRKADVLPIRKVVTPVSGHDIVGTGWEIESGTGRMKVYFRNHWSKAWASTSGNSAGTQPQDTDGDDGWFYFDQHVLSEAYIITEIPDALLDIVRSLPSKENFNFNWGVDMNVGSTGVDVQALQIALKIVGTFPFNQPVTTYFGSITAKAVMDFQTQYGIADAATIAAAHGRCGQATRAALNKIFAHK